MSLMRPFQLTNSLTTHDAKAMLLRLDPADDEAERTARMDIEEAAQKDIAKALNGQQKELLSSIRQYDSAPDWMREEMEATLTQIREDQDLQDMLQRALMQSSSLGVEVAVRQFANVGMAFDWTLAHEGARNFANSFTPTLVRGINGTTERLLRQSITAWIDNGLPLQDLIDQLVPVFGEERSQMIASTEVTRAYTYGTREAYRTSKVVQEMIWYTVLDERRCPFCSALHGEVVGIEERFSDALSDDLRDQIGTFELPPAHPRCRCFVAARITA